MSNVHKPDGVFSYTYCAKQQEEVKRIREKYAPREEDKMEQLRRLDAGAARKGTMVSICMGTVSSLILGTGMSMCMVMTQSLFIPGIVIGVIGLLGCAAAYPVYTHIVKEERARVAPKILELTDELLK